MREIGRDMHEKVNAFHVGPPHDAQLRILDLCVAPGGFLAVALRVHPRGQAVGFTLSEAAGGHKLRLLSLKRVQMTYVDITMLAADLGLDVDDIPPDHPDRDQFILERLLPVPPSPDASEEEEKTEDRVEKVEEKAEEKDAATEDGLFKSLSTHANRSSFYLVALGVCSRDAEAREAVRLWERVWRVATLGTDDEYVAVFHEGAPEVEELLEEFGQRLIELVTPAWEIQVQALEKAPFMKKEQRGTLWRVL